MKTSKLCIFLLLIVLLFSPAYAAKTKINFWFCVPQIYLPVIEELIQKYNEEKPYYQIVPRNFETPELLLEKLSMGNVHPEVAIIDAAWQKELVLKNKIENVEDVMNKIGTSLKVVFKMDTFPALWNASVYEDKIWTVPLYVSNRAILYNPQILKNNKMKAPPKTWEDFIKTGAKISKNGVYALTIPSDVNDKEAGFIFDSFLMQTGGNLSNLNGSNYEKAIRFCSDIINKHKICSTDSIDPNSTAMFIGKIEDYFNYKNSGMNLKAAPMLKGSSAGSYFNLYNMAVFTNIKVDPMKVWNFVYWFSEFPQATIWALKTPYLPANKQVTLSPEYFQYLQDNPEVYVFIKELSVGKTETGLNNYETVMSAIGKDFKMVMSGNKTIEEALRMAGPTVRNE